MKNRKLPIVLMICVVVIAAMICIIGGIAASADDNKTDAEKMREMADRVENAILSVDDSYKKQIEVVTYPLTYQDANGNTIVFTQCHTKYYEADPSEIDGLHIESIESVISLPDEYENCSVGEMVAAWFEKNDRAFLCWTISPEVSCVIEYSPDSVMRADIFKMAESVAPLETKK